MEKERKLDDYFRPLNLPAIVFSFSFQATCWTFVIGYCSNTSTQFLLKKKEAFTSDSPVGVNM